jgi:DNA repair protein RecO (recombination protein O)
MANQRTYIAEALILRRSDFQEADRRLTLLTPDRGRLTVVAKGVRRPASRMAGHLELFTLAKVFVVRRRSLDLIVQAETVQTFPELRADLQRLPYAYQAVEAALILVEEEVEAHAEFILLVKALDALARTAALPLVLVAYKLQLLAMLGYQAQLRDCARCGKALNAQESVETPQNRVRPDSGGVVCATCGGASGLPLTVRAIKCLRWLAQEPLHTVERLQVDPNTISQLEQTADVFVRYVAEQDLKSAPFLERMRALKTNP